MEALVNLIVSLWNELFPWVKIEPWQRGVRTFLGHWPQHIGPGIWWALPFVQTVEVLETTRDVTKLMAQSLETTDGVRLLISGVLSYSIVNMRLMYINVQDYEESLAVYTTGLIGDFVTSHDSEEVTKDSLCAYILQELKPIALGWGIGVHDFQVADFSEARVMRWLTS